MGAAVSIAAIAAFVALCLRRQRQRERGHHRLLDMVHDDSVSVFDAGDDSCEFRKSLQIRHISNFTLDDGYATSYFATPATPPKGRYAMQSTVQPSPVRLSPHTPSFPSALTDTTKHSSHLGNSTEAQHSHSDSIGGSTEAQHGHSDPESSLLLPTRPGLRNRKSGNSSDRMTTSSILGVEDYELQGAGYLRPRDQLKVVNTSDEEGEIH